MADVCRLLAQPGLLTGTLTADYKGDTASEKFYIKLDTATRDIVSVANSARAANPSQFPLRGEPWPVNPGYGLYAKTHAFSNLSELGSLWECVVTYMPLDPSEPNTNGNSNPLLWPAVYGLEWLEEDVPITRGRNVEAIGSGTTAGERVALTLGEIVNSALQEFDEGLFRTRRTPVITVTKNVGTLDEVYYVQKDFEDTTNSDTIGSVEPRRMEYLCVEHNGQQTANGTLYYARTVKIALKKTTDRRINNRGWNYWKTIDSVKTLVPFTVKQEGSTDETLTSEPAFLTLAGGKATAPTTVTYRVLEEVPYASLLS